MNIPIAQLQTFSDTDLLAIYRYALANGAFRQEVTINGRTLRVPDAKTCRETIAWLEVRIQDDANAASGEGGNVAVVTFDDAT